MTIDAVYAALACVIFVIGLRGLFLQPHLLHKVLALNVMSSGVFLLLVAIARRNADPRPDPVPLAMVLTGIVVAVSVSGLAIVLARRLYVTEAIDRSSEHEDAG